MTCCGRRLSLHTVFGLTTSYGGGLTQRGSKFFWPARRMSRIRASHAGLSVSTTPLAPQAVSRGSVRRRQS